VTETPNEAARSPLVVLQERAWAKLDPATRERVIELRRERDESGEPTWKEERQDDPPIEGESEDSGWTRLVLRPIDPFDTREPILIGSWPTKFLDDEYANEQARAKEHHGDEEN
jgi:hypothetical protein